MSNEEVEVHDLEGLDTGTLEDNLDGLSEPLRVEEKVRMFWKGVSKCCDRKRVNAEAGSQFGEWVEQQKKKHPDRIAVRWGHGGGRVTCNHVGGGWGGARKCTASVSVNAFIDFV